MSQPAFGPEHADHPDRRRSGLRRSAARAAIGAPRNLCCETTASRTPAASAVATMASASARVFVIGFSTMTCLPAACGGLGERPVGRDRASPRRQRRCRFATERGPRARGHRLRAPWRRRRPDGRRRRRRASPRDVPGDHPGPGLAHEARPDHAEPDGARPRVQPSPVPRRRVSRASRGRRSSRPSRRPP